LSAGYVFLAVVAVLIVWGLAAGRAIRRPLASTALPLAAGERLLFPHPEFTLAHQVFLTSDRLLWLRVPLVPLHPFRVAATPLLLVGRLVSRRDPRLAQDEFSLRLDALDRVDVAPLEPGRASTPALQLRSQDLNVAVFFTSRRNTPEAWKAAIDQRRRARR
jgi:hypothetical protein